MRGQVDTHEVPPTEIGQASTTRNEPVKTTRWDKMNNSVWQVNQSMAEHYVEVAVEGS